MVNLKTVAQATVGQGAGHGERELSKVATVYHSVTCCAWLIWYSLTAACKRWKPQRFENHLPGVYLGNICLCKVVEKVNQGSLLKHSYPGIFLQVSSTCFWLPHLWEIGGYN